MLSLNVHFLTIRLGSTKTNKNINSTRYNIGNINTNNIRNAIYNKDRKAKHE